ncbi:GHKL domain-containing protein [Mediterraneibacter gnavus]|jgi:histidine kinase-, DNA gyrase B-, and HSP90-like ATPase|uniref:GHKL domain-containing protein n=1 Tax=Mediterraneibacter gnavus TaxID=33038 RepID=A0A415S7C5_MEDGN|nr:ATP-binding protein [Mediterraneibacter gnavus]MDU2007860.1 ATP-binding protein [Lachnospiraceae bacterium]RHM72766.1 GHKL domain-containing protein [Mediterraneibacter gnavus]
MLLFSNAYMFFLYEGFVEKNQKEKELRSLYIKSSLENQYLCHVEKINEKHRLIIHDINKYIRTCIELISKGEIDRGLALFESIHFKLNSNHQRIYSVNRVLNALLTERVEEAKNKNIKFNINIDPTLNINFINDIDMISILGNLLDNALEAAGKNIENAFVDLDMYMANENSFLVIEIKNNFLKKPISKGKYYLSTKKDKTNHGIGMYAVEKIITSYDGNIKIDINEEKKEFFVQIILHTFNYKQK